MPRCRISVPPFARMSSTSAAISPPKAHHHQPIPASAFPRGFILGGTHAGVKKNASIPDLALAVSTSARPTAAAGVFTRNAVAAAPVLVSAQVLAEGKGHVRGVVVNSGCANAVTGKRGLEDAWKMVRAADDVLAALDGNGKRVAGSESLVMSTGVIGQTLPIDNILRGISSLSTKSPSAEDENAPLGSTFAHWERAARAFMTTDTFPKLRARTFRVGSREYRLGGMSKGAGMIHPDMGGLAPKAELHATLLSLILTDAPVAPAALQRALEYATARSFNSISVDGDMSTNDTVLVLANGAAVPAASADAIEIDDTRSPVAYGQFRDALTGFAAELAQLVVRDGEGATKFVTVTVDGAKTYEDAHAVASRISTSALVKTALYGEDANWGRILAATGSLSSLSTPLDPERISVSFVPTDGSAALPLLVAGEPCGVDEVRAKEILSGEDLEIRVELGLGKESARYWTCDFSYEYVKINGDYRS
ncbi:arginine biosynthesis protein ArgJ [Phellopilus nigrolimitatus]|nr:arginine biosynthesis protein ArgJ [Phellopilus nigrolimitatus]